MSCAIFGLALLGGWAASRCADAAIEVNDRPKCPWIGVPPVPQKVARPLHQRSGRSGARSVGLKPLQWRSGFIVGSVA
jgi:hypothetical protein